MLTGLDFVVDLPSCLKSILGAAHSDTAIDYVVAGHAIEHGGMTPALPTSAAGAPVYSSAGTVRQPDFSMQPACTSAGASCLPCSGSRPQHLQHTADIAAQFFVHGAEPCP